MRSKKATIYRYKMQMKRGFYRVKWGVIVVVAEIWRKLGYTEEQSEELEMLSTINNDDIKNINSDTATKTLLKTMKKYRLDKDEVKRIIEKFNEIAN